MGSVYKPTYTKPLPEGAELHDKQGQPMARWQDRRGKTRTARVSHHDKDSPRIVLESSRYSAKYRDGQGVVRKVATGCTTKDGALARLRELEKRAERVRSGLTTADEDAVLDQQQTPLSDHVEAYLDHLRTKRGKGAKPTVSPKHVANVRHNLNRLIEQCRFRKLADLNRETVERWVAQQIQRDDPGDGLSYRTINAHLAAISAFGSWCEDSHRLISSPFKRLRKLDESSDVRHQRRALSEEEIGRLLYVTRRRPLAEYGRETIRLPEEHREGRRTWKKAPLTLDNLDAAYERARARLADSNPDFVQQQENLGWQRMLIYKTLMLTGLRKGELAALTVWQLEFDPDDDGVAYVSVAAIEDKGGKAAQLPLRADLAKGLREWLDHRLAMLREEAREQGEPLPARLPRDAPVFDVPDSLNSVQDRDLAVAGIPKRDDRDRVFDIHGLRHTFCSHLSRAGVPVRTAQAAMRHSTIELTMKHYTDPRLLDVAGAIKSLPELTGERSAETRGGTSAHPAAERPPRKLGPDLVPTPGHEKAYSSSDVTRDVIEVAKDSDVSGESDGACHEMATNVSKRAKGLEPSTFSLEG